MALQCDKAVTTNQGFTVPTGSYIRFNASKSFAGFDVSFDLVWFLNKAAFDNGNSPVIITELPRMGFTEPLTELQFNGLLGTGVDTRLEFHNIIINWLATHAAFEVSDFQIVS